MSAAGRLSKEEIKMKTPCKTISSLSLAIAALLLAGCASTPSDQSTEARFPKRYVATDGRIIDIGQRTASEGGWSFRDPHLDQCWIADDFNFTGYDTLYIAPTASTAILHGPQEDSPHALAKENLVIELQRMLRSKGIFTNIVTAEADLKPDVRVLKWENTITEYAKGGGAARYWAGLFGGGQPVLRVKGNMTSDGRKVFTFEAHRSGVSTGARLAGAFMSDVNIQLEDIDSMAIDLTDFMAAIAGRYEPKN
jgi:hypothetical protein